MKRLLLSALLFLFAGNALAKDVSVSFDGNTYHLAYAKEAQANAVNEYIPAGSTLDNWKKLIGVHIYHTHGVSPEQFAIGLGQQLKQKNPQAKYEIIKNPKTGEAIIDFFTWTEQEPVIAEFNIFKFKKVSGSDDLIAYQYAFRNYGPLTQAYADEFKNNRLRLRKLVVETSYPAFVPEKEFQH